MNGPTPSSTALTQPWRLPPRGLAVFHGECDAPRLSHYFLPRLVLEGKRILFLDGANCANPRLMARLAERRGVPFAQFNRQIKLARAFTCFQLTELISRVPQFLAEFPAQVLMVTAFPELYFDEDIRPADASAAFKQALDHLRRWASQTTVALFSSVTGFHPPVCRKLFFAQTCAVATELWKFQLDDRGELGLTRQGTAKQVAEKPFGTVILRSPALRDDLPAQAGEESRSSMKMRRARSFSCRAGSG